MSDATFSPFADRSAKAATRLSPSTLTPLLLRVAETATILAVSQRSIWRLIGTGELETVRVGGTVRIKRTSLERFIDRGGAG